MEVVDATKLLSDPETDPWLKNSLAYLVSKPANEAMELLLGLIGAINNELDESEGDDFKWMGEDEVAETVN